MNSRPEPHVEHARLISRRALIGAVGLGAAGLALNACADATRSASSASTTSPTAVPLRLAVPDPQIVVRGESVAPRDTDPAIDTALEPHYAALSAAVQSRGRLFVFLPGTGADADAHRFITDQAARNGFHGLALRYPNADRIQALCGTDTDTTCFEKTRLETIDGTDRSPKVNVNRANSIENRLTKALSYLEAKHPGEGWGGFIESGAPKWASIVTAGHSQGGGHAALIARDHLVARVAMFSSPVDHVGPVGRQVGSSQPPPWLLGAHVTPSDSYYSLGHVQDENNDWELQWKALGLGLTTFGPSANADKDLPPYSGSHLLTTSVEPRKSALFSLPYHSSTAVDVCTPLTAAGRPLLAAAWQYLCFA